MMRMMMMIIVRERFKVRIIEELKRKNQRLKSEIQNDDDLRVIQVRETNKQKKHKTRKCSPRIRKVIRDNAHQLYLESQAYSVYDLSCHNMPQLSEIWSYRKKNALKK